jgi:hypothetical protein
MGRRRGSTNMKTLAEARAAKPRALETFGRVARISGIGITRCNDGYGLKVNLAQPPDRGVRLPAEIDGVPVRVEVVGRIRKREVA